MANAIECAEALEHCVLTYQGGFKNETALRDITRHVNTIFWTEVAASYEAGTVLDWAKILYSAKKHEPWGVDRVQSIVLECCASLRMKLEQLQGQEHR